MDSLLASDGRMGLFEHCCRLLSWEEGRKRLLGCFVIAVAISGTSSVHLRVNVPPYKSRGDSAVLECDYYMEKDAIHSAKWYKDDLEFIRFLPAENQNTQYFPVMGVNLDARNSTHRNVFLQNLSFNSTGVYKCEVSVKFPSLTSAYLASMTVMALPTEHAHITGIKRTNYNVGDRIITNCTSSFSKPAAEIQWIVNGKEVEHTFLRFYPNEITADELEGSTLGLNFEITESHFSPDNRLSLVCRSSVIIHVVKGSQANSTQVLSKSNIFVERRETEIQLCRSSSSSGRHFVILFPSTSVVVLLRCL